MRDDQNPPLGPVSFQSIYKVLCVGPASNSWQMIYLYIMSENKRRTPKSHPKLPIASGSIEANWVGSPLRGSETVGGRDKAEFSPAREHKEPLKDDSCADLDFFRIPSVRSMMT